MRAKIRRLRIIIVGSDRVGHHAVDLVRLKMEFAKVDGHNSAFQMDTIEASPEYVSFVDTFLNLNQ